MKILIANPPCRTPLADGLEKWIVRAGARWTASFVKQPDEPVTQVPFPFFLAYAAALLEREPGVVVTARDSIATNDSEAQFLAYVANLKPDLVFFEVPTIAAQKDGHLIQRSKDAGVGCVVVGGPHPTTFPREMLGDCGALDYCLLAEYELNLRDLVRALSGRQKLQDVMGIAYREGQEIIIRKGSLIDPLDQLPPPARHLFPSPEAPGVDLYWDVFTQSFPLIEMHASRGCPYRCNFCLWNQVMYDNGKYRTFSPKRVVDEMLDCVERFHAQEVYFDDDTFTGNRRFVLDLCDEMIRRGVPGRMAWSAMADAIVTDEEMINRMADAGCIGLKFGVESGDEEVLRRIGKPLSLAKAHLFVKRCAARHIKTHATFTFGMSGETPATMQKTLDFALQLDSDSVQFSVNTPFPGTRYFNELQSKSLLLTTDWSRYDGYNGSVAKFEHLSETDVARVYSGAYRKWLRRKLTTPSWVLRQAYNWNRLRRRRGLGFACALLGRLARGSM